MQIDLREMFNCDAFVPALKAIRDPKLVRPDYVGENLNGLTEEIREQFKLIVFDLDRTLVNEGEARVHAKIREFFTTYCPLKLKLL